MLTQAAPTRADTKVKPALLFVDDERRVLTSMRAMFRREYDVLLANSGYEALEILEKRDDIHVVVSDQRMPGMTGVELLATVKGDYPSSMRILLTGYADLDAVEASINESEVFRYLMKPCPTDELKDAVALAVQAARVSEMAGVDELAAVPDDELEKIEMVDVLEESVQDAMDDALIYQVEEITNAAEVPELLETEFAETALYEVFESAEGASKEIEPAPFVATETAEDIDDSIENTPVQPETVDPEVLVLTQDADLLEGVNLAIGPQYAVREADSIDVALRRLSEHPIGVLITDLAVNESEIDELTRVLKHEVPELVTIIASERSDAALLIGLINHGQIFRFLLKPLQVAQTRIWLNSAMTKYAELCADNNKVLRHRVVRNAEVEAANKGLFADVRSRIQSIKKRFASSLLAGLSGVRGE